MSTPSVVVVGDVVLDRDLVGRVDRVCPDAPVPVLDLESRSGGPGGAGLAALLCLRPEVDVTLVAPVGEDADGLELRRSLEQAGVRLVGLAQEGATRTKTRLRSGGQSLLRVDDGGPATPAGPVPPEAVGVIEAADVLLVSCYGNGTTAHDELRALLSRRARQVPVVWDPHPRGAPPVPGCTVVTPNLDEARTFAQAATSEGPDGLAACLTDLWSAAAVCVTTGAGGAWLATCDGTAALVPATPADGDACGAGDAFAAAVATELACGRTTPQAVRLAVARAADWVRGEGTSGFRSRQVQEAQEPQTPALHDRTSALGASMDVVRTVRAHGGTVVATGGCFDILHAGHLACLEGARRLGDALVVLLNSDDSVRRLKGPGRPVQPAADRARLLQGLACVDAVIVFDEDTPQVALDQLRPDLWVKGGDYEEADLPEAQQVRSWGGQVVLLPLLPGHSTTAILTGAR